MERATKTAIKKLVLDLRHLLEEDIGVVLKRYGLFTNREWLEESRIPKADAELLATRARMAAAVSVEIARGIKRGEATHWYIREVAFTYLNRLVGLKCLEVRGLIDEVITTRVEYSGRSQFHRDFRHEYPQLAAKPDDALPDMLEAACRFVTDEMIGVLFDPDSESSDVWPRVQTLRQAIELINGLPTEVWAEDEIIGWIYQFYNAEEKEKIRKQGKPKLPIEVAVINQFFTPRWVVKYLVDNTLGRLWLEMYPDSARVRVKCDYLVPESLPTDDETTSVEANENKFTPDPNSPINNPQAPARRQAKPVTQIRLIDPACGAMHFGYYAFEVFQEMYQDARDRGWPIWSVDYNRGQRILPPTSDAEIPALILAHNLYGVDIDLRAVQLAALALYMKARVAERAVNPRHRSQYRVNLVCADARLTNGGLRQRFLEQYKDDPKLQHVWRELFTEMEDIAQVGSLLRPEERLRQLLEAYQPPTIQLETTQRLQLPNMPQKPRQMMLAEAPGGEKWTPRRTLSQMMADLHKFATKALSEADVNAQLFATEAEKTVGLLEVLSNDYDAVVMNPPYGTYYNTTKVGWNYIKSNYPSSDMNVLCAFVERSVVDLCKSGYVGAITDRGFINKSRYEKFRKDIFLSRTKIVVLADLGWGILDDAQVETVSFVLSSGKLKKESSKSIFFRLDDRGTDNFNSLLSSLKHGNPRENTHTLSQKTFNKFPNTAFLYWLPDSLHRYFDYPTLEPDLAQLKVGINPGDASRFFRFHWEINQTVMGTDWKFLSNGGAYSPYYRNFEQVIYYANNGEIVKNYPGAIPANADYYLLEGITYGKRTDYISFQILPGDHLFTVEGEAIFPNNKDDQLWLLAALNSQLVRFIANTICGQHKYAGYLRKIPFLPPPDETKKLLSNLAKISFDLRKNWDVGNETNSKFTRPWLLQLPSFNQNSHESVLFDSLDIVNKYVTVQDVPQKPQISLSLDWLLYFESEINNYLENIQTQVDNMIYRLYDIGESDRAFMSTDLGISMPENVWPYMNNNKPKEKRREHVRRLLSYLISEAIKVDEDGILPFFAGTGHTTVLEQLRYQLELEFGTETAFQLEDDAGKELGCSVESWLNGPYIQWHTKLYKKRPILWHLASPNNTFAVLLYYHKLDKDALPKIRNVYLRAIRDSLRRQLDAARQDKDNKTITQLETTLDDLLQMEEKLQAVIESGYNPVIDDGVKANILPLQEAGLLRYNNVV